MKFLICTLIFISHSVYAADKVTIFGTGVSIEADGPKLDLTNHTYNEDIEYVQFFPAYNASGEFEFDTAIWERYPNVKRFYMLCGHNPDKPLLLKGFSFAKSRGNLSWVHIGGCDLSESTPELFQNLPRLRLISLTQNCIHFNRESFANSVSINNISIYKVEDMECTSSITSIEDYALSHIASLTDLTIMGELGVSLEEVNDIKSLEVLKLHKSEITTIKQDSFNNLSKLRSISLHGDRLQKIEPGAFNGLGQLEYFSLIAHALSSLDLGTFMGMPSVESFNLRSGVNVLPAGLFKDVGNTHHAYIELSGLTPETVSQIRSEFKYPVSIPFSNRR